MLLFPGRWLVEPKGNDWSWFDLGTGTFVRAEELDAHDEAKLVFDDGTLLLVRAGRLLRLDPATGDTQAIDVCGSSVARWLEVGSHRA